MVPLLLVAVVGCGLGPDASEGVVPFEPAPARLHRLTDAQLRNAYVSLTGVAWTGALPDDYVLYGYAAVGSAEATLSPVELEEVEAAAWGVAQAAIPDAATATAFMGCSPGQRVDPITTSLETDPCLRGFVAGLGRRAWRRPLAGSEVDELAELWRSVAGSLSSDPTMPTQAVLALLLQSPDFLYRVELGEDDPDAPGRRRLDGFELASRLAFLLTDGPPDDGLLLAAEDGSLLEDAVLRHHAERLLATDAAREALSRFFDETLNLAELDLVQKDAETFPEWTPTLKEAMREEIHLIVEQLVLDEDQPLDALFTTNLAYVNDELGAIYGLTMTGSELQPVVLPERAARGGILGRAAFLTIESNATFNSPTHRGKYVRSRLLCQDIPAPPPGIPTLDAQGSEGTLRQRLEQHMEDPSCNGCHRLMDPIGFGFEHFNPVGRWVDRDSGYPIDATGELDGQKFDGAVELGEAIAGHEALPGCVARNFYRHAVGALEGESEEGAIEALTEEFLEGDLRLRSLILGLVLSEGFWTIDSPADGACEVEGEARPCATDCGSGVEFCRGGVWTGCNAPAPAAEVCDGADQDCDGTADEEVLRACEGPGGPGVQECLSAQWQVCR